MTISSGVGPVGVIIRGPSLELSRGSGTWGGTQRQGEISGSGLLGTSHLFSVFSRHLQGTSSGTGAVLGTGGTEVSETSCLPSGVRRTLKKREEATRERAAGVPGYLRSPENGELDQPEAGKASWRGWGPSRALPNEGGDEGTA